MKPVIPSILIKSGNKKLKPQSKKSDEDFNQPEYEISKSDKIKITDIEQRFQNCEKVDIQPKIELEGDVSEKSFVINMISPDSDSPFKDESKSDEFKLEMPKVKFIEKSTSQNNTKCLSTNEIKYALIELYVAVKVRNDKQLEFVNHDSLKIEKKQLYDSQIDILTLILYLKSTF